MVNGLRDLHSAAATLEADLLHNQFRVVKTCSNMNLRTAARPRDGTGAGGCHLETGARVIPRRAENARRRIEVIATPSSLHLGGAASPPHCARSSGAVGEKDVKQAAEHENVSGSSR